MEDPNGEKFLAEASLPPTVRLIRTGNQTHLAHFLTITGEAIGQPGQILRETFTAAIGQPGFPPMAKVVTKKGKSVVRFCHLWKPRDGGCTIKWKIGDLAEGSAFANIKWKEHERSFPGESVERLLNHAIDLWLESFYHSQFRMIFRQDEETANQIFNRPPESPPISGEQADGLAPGNLTYLDFMQQRSKEEIDKWLSKLDDAYYNNAELVPNEIFDILIELYEARFGKRVKIGAPPPSQGAVELPIAMMSLDKIKKADELKKFMEKNPGPYVVMGKVNGNAGLLGPGFLYNRGNGTIGSNVTRVLPYLKVPAMPPGVFVKGEVVIDKKDYEPHSMEYKTNLSMINALLNPLATSPDVSQLKFLRFIAYDIATTAVSNYTMSQTLTMLQQSGFVVPYWVRTETLNIEALSALFKDRKENQEYDVDGLVIVADRVVPYEERLIRSNPSYAIAFKEYGERKVGTVIEVLWKASKHMQLKPRVSMTPVTFGGFTVQSSTAFNAGWIRDNKIGPGAELLMVHNTIPYILGVVKGTEAMLPPDPENWGWNATQVDIVLKAETHEVRIQRVYEFFDQIKAKYVGEKLITKLYAAGCTTVKMILEATRDQFLLAQIPGVGAGIIDRMQKSIHEALCNVTLARLMSASCVFGHGFGVRMINPVLEMYPDIMMRDRTLVELVQVPGYGDLRAQRFIEGMPKFRAFMADCPILIQYLQHSMQQHALKAQARQAAMQAESQAVQTGGVARESLDGKTIVFTGTRDKALEAAMEDRGGKVGSGVTKATFMLVNGGGKGDGSSKEKKAKEYGLPILSHEEFKARFGL